MRDSPVTGHPVVGTAKLPLRLLPADGRMSVWLPLDAPSKGLTAQGEILLDVTYRTFEDDDQVRVTVHVCAVYRSFCCV